MKGMTLRAMTEAVNGIYHGNGEDYDKEITAITIDSRKVAEGGLLLQLKVKEVMAMIYRTVL